MLKQELIEKISKYFKLTNFEAENIINDIFKSIINGVKKDKIVDIEEFGEFIIKYNGHGRSVEFLPASTVDEEVNKLKFNGAENTAFTINEKEDSKENVTNISEINNDIEDEIRRKRESILRELQKDENFKLEPVLILNGENKEEEQNNVKPVKNFIKEEIPAFKQAEKESTDEIESETQKSFSDYFTEIKNDIENKLSLTEEQKKEVPVEEPEKEIPVEEPEKKEPEKEDNQRIPIEEPVKEVPVEEPEKKEPVKDSFLIAENNGIITINETIADEITEPIQPEDEKEDLNDNLTALDEQVIDPKAVALHNEIMSDSVAKENTEDDNVIKTLDLKQTEEPEVTENRADDNSYYLWFKNSESTPTETQTLSYEYELLYQAQKEAEYKSKLKIYVTTFILFFSFVLSLLIFSPIIYKIFFTPADLQIEQVPNESINKESQNLNDRAAANNDQTEPVLTPNEQTEPEAKENENQVQQTPPPAEEQKQEEMNPPQTEPEPQNTDGLAKNGMGWTDEKNKVIYIFENNVYSIQESAWDNESKAQKRIATVEGFKIAGLNGKVVKAEITGKGVWYRARFGEFSTLEEARNKANELRSRERTRVQAFLLSFFMFT